MRDPSSTSIQQRILILPGPGEGQNSDRLDRWFEFVVDDSL